MASVKSVSLLVICLLTAVLPLVAQEAERDEDCCLAIMEVPEQKLELCCCASNKIIEPCCEIKTDKSDPLFLQFEPSTLSPLIFSSLNTKTEFHLWVPEQKLARIHPPPDKHRHSLFSQKTLLLN